MRLSLLIAGLLLAVFAAAALAQDAGLPAEHHPWGRFPFGSWKRVRVVTENLDPLGNVTGTTINETKTTLIAADASTYTLAIEVTIEASGKRFARPKQTTQVGYSGQTTGETLTAKKTGDAEVTLNGRKILCEVRQLTISGDGKKYDGTIHYNPAVSPYILRKEGTASGSDDAPKVNTTSEVLAIGMPYRVLADQRSVSFVRTIEKRGDRTTTTVEATCDDVPGGDVAHSSQEQNAEGKTLHRTTLELVDYHVGNDKPAEAWGGRRRVHRSRPRRME